jgi:hypothetical protein
MLQDDPVFDDEVDSLLILDEHQLVDAPAAPLADGDAWDWNDEADSLVISDEHQLVDAPATPTPPVADAWDWNDVDWPLTPGVEGSQQSDVFVVSAELSVETGPMFDGADEDLDELTIDDFSNFTEDPGLPEDVWPHWYDPETDDGLLAAVIADDRPAVADVVAAPTHPVADDWAHWSDPEGDESVASMVSYEPVVADNAPPVTVQVEDAAPWAEVEPVDDWWHAIDAVQLLDLSPQEPLQADAWPWHEDHDPEGDPLLSLGQGPGGFRLSPNPNRLVVKAKTDAAIVK